MSRQTRTSRRFAVLAGAGGAVMLGALVVVAIAIAAPQSAKSTAKLTAGHKCLVMAGSGDPAFVRNFNPYTATSVPSGAFVRGAMYEPLLVARAGGGGHL